DSCGDTSRPPGTPRLPERWASASTAPSVMSMLVSLKRGTSLSRAKGEFLLVDAFITTPHRGGFGLVLSSQPHAGRFVNLMAFAACAAPTANDGGRSVCRRSELWLPPGFSRG